MKPIKNLQVTIKYDDGESDYGYISEVSDSSVWITLENDPLPIIMSREEFSDEQTAGTIVLAELEDINSAVDEILERYKYQKHLKVVIDGEEQLFDADHIRALQVFCKRYSELGKYQEFIERVQVYDTDGNINLFNERGIFEHHFKSGIYSCHYDLAFEVL